MAYKYAVIGAGRQGTAAGYDLARFGEAESILLADQDRPAAERACSRLNALLGRQVARAAEVEASDPHAVAGLLRQHRIQAFVSAVPYFFNLGLTHAALQAGCGMTDLGGNSQVVLEQLDLASDAEQAGVSIVPDCGQVPGMGTSLIVYAIEQLDQAQDVIMWDCGLPQRPEPPWNYRLTFSIEGLTNEYHGEALYIRDGRTTAVPALEEVEIVEFPEPIGPLEAFTTAGGLTTAARTFAGSLRRLENKTLRYPGHLAQLHVLRDLGLLETKPVSVDGQPVVPRHVLHALWEPRIRADAATRDLIIIRIRATGRRAGTPAEALVELIHTYDERTGFTAMEQGTGWHAAILTAAIARGQVTRGVVPVELAMSGSAFVAEAEKRGFQIRLSLETS